jgi:N-6 DNA Methylase
LWFFDKGKTKTARKDQVLFIDARHVFRQIDRAHPRLRARASRVSGEHRAVVARRTD